MAVGLAGTRGRVAVRWVSKGCGDCVVVGQESNGGAVLWRDGVRAETNGACGIVVGWRLAVGGINRKSILCLLVLEGF